MTWWEEQERGNLWFCGACEQRTPIKAMAPRHKPGCPYAPPTRGAAEQRTMRCDGGPGRCYPMPPRGGAWIGWCHECGQAWEGNTATTGHTVCMRCFEQIATRMAVMGMLWGRQYRCRLTAMGPVAG